MKLGIIGGVSPYASSKFYNQLCEEYRSITSNYPSILIYSLQVSIKQEKEFLTNHVNVDTINNLKRQIDKACKIFKDNEIDIVIICCNTLSTIFSDIAKNYGFKNIMTPVQSLSNHGNNRCLLLATSYTNDKNLYKNFMRIDKQDQIILEKFIEEKINRNNSKINLDNIIKKYDCDTVALGCTDISKEDIKTSKQIIDSSRCLLNDVLKAIGDI